MKRMSARVAAGYGLWVGVNIFITVFQIGDAGVNSHLALLFTGAPVSLFSLLVPHGSLLGVVLAGALGLFQWAAVAELYPSKPRAIQKRFRRQSGAGGPWVNGPRGPAPFVFLMSCHSSSQPSVHSSSRPPILDVSIQELNCSEKTFRLFHIIFFSAAIQKGSKSIRKSTSSFTPPTLRSWLKIKPQ